jgi:hypothetical protein
MPGKSHPKTIFCPYPPSHPPSFCSSNSLLSMICIAGFESIVWFASDETNSHFTMIMDRSVIFGSDFFGFAVNPGWKGQGLSSWSQECCCLRLMFFFIVIACFWRFDWMTLKPMMYFSPFRSLRWGFSWKVQDSSTHWSLFVCLPWPPNILKWLIWFGWRGRFWVGSIRWGLTWNIWANFKFYNWRRASHHAKVHKS